jgi:glycosyltransferase involved in cell wall biosynthesis
VVWLYSPAALPIARRLDPATLVYDVMDDLAAFDGAAPELQLRHAQALAEADLVFTGGRTLHERVLEHRRRPSRTVCLTSGVDVDHFDHPRVPHDRPVAGYTGVIDERLDLDLVAELARRLPDWIIRMVGPVAKIGEDRLPRAANIEYTGKREYRELPAILAGFDVALMPFAHNRATASISPTKTLEYLAAGLPTVSTRVRDVVRDHSAVVALADDAAGFARACEQVREGSLALPRDAVRAHLRQRSWDGIVAQMSAHLADDALVRRRQVASA